MITNQYHEKVYQHTFSNGFELFFILKKEDLFKNLQEL